MATALSLDLVLNMTTSGTGFDERAYRTSNVECATETGIDIHQDRQRADVGYPAYIRHHVV